MEKQFDVIIAGNGILGASTAIALARRERGLRIALVGPAGRPEAASAAAGAMLNSFAEIEKGTLDSEPQRVRFAMNLAATRLWPAWIESLNRDAGTEAVRVNLGTYVVHNARIDEMDDDNFDEIVRTLEAHKEPFEHVDPRAIKGLSPTAQARALRAIYIPNEGSLRSGTLLSALDRVLQAAPGVEVFDDAAVQLTVRDDGTKVLATVGGLTVTAPKLLVASGAKSQVLIDQLPELAKRIPRLFHGVGIAMLLRTRGLSPDKCIRTPNRGMACGVHVVPYDRDVSYVGATNVVSPLPETHPTMTGLFGLMEAAMEQINQQYYAAHMERWIVGHRPTTLDTFPLIGQTSIPGLFILSGTRREGIHVSPLLAQALAGELLGEPWQTAHPFQPERALIHTMTREEGILKTVAHLKSSAYQHGLQVPNNGWCNVLDGMLRNEVEQVYRACGIEDHGIPPEFLGIYKFGLTGGLARAPSLAVGA